MFGLAISCSHHPGSIRGWAAGVIHIIDAEMEKYEAGVYIEKVLEGIKVFSETVMPNFPKQVEVIIAALSANVPQPFVKNEITSCKRIEAWKCGVNWLCCGFINLLTCSYEEKDEEKKAEVFF